MIVLHNRLAQKPVCQQILNIYIFFFEREKPIACATYGMKVLFQKKDPTIDTIPCSKSASIEASAKHIPKITPN